MGGNDIFLSGLQVGILLFDVELPLGGEPFCSMSSVQADELNSKFSYSSVL